MKKIIFLLFALITVCGFGQSILTNYAENQLLVQFKQSFSLPEIEGVDFVECRNISKRLNIYLLEFQSNRYNAEEMLEFFKQRPDVDIAQFNHKVSPRQIPNDPYFSQQWGMENDDDHDIDITSVWDYTTGGQTVNGDDIVVAVIDTGFDLNHDDINYFRNEHENRYNHQDDDGNNYVDDYYGWNAYNHSGVIQPTSHGTHVAGIIGASGNNAVGIAGVNWNVKILPVMGASEYESVVMEAYDYVLSMRTLYNVTNGEMGAFVVVANSSFGVDQGNIDEYPLWDQMLDTMGSEGILSVGSTANQNFNVDVVGDIPSNCTSEYLIVVTSTNQNDEKVLRAGFGATSVDLGAPGANIMSCITNDGYNTMSGCSMSAGFVSGAIALLYSAASTEFMELVTTNPSQAAIMFKNCILSGVDPIPSLNGITTTGGRLNVFNSYNLLPFTYSADEINQFKPQMAGNYPNPFNPSTTLWFESKEKIMANASIYNLKGQKIKTIFNGLAKQGTNSFAWNGYDEQNQKVSSGVYFFKVKTKNTSITKKIVLMK